MKSIEKNITAEKNGTVLAFEPRVISKVKKGETAWSFPAFTYTKFADNKRDYSSAPATTTLESFFGKELWREMIVEMVEDECQALWRATEDEAEFIRRIQTGETGKRGREASESSKYDKLMKAAMKLVGDTTKTTDERKVAKADVQKYMALYQEAKMNELNEIEF